LKKQMKKKLALQKETLANLRWVGGGAEALTDFCGTSVINDTVYHPQPSEQCTRGCPIQA
jgi:hypothetical protein